MYLTSLKDDFNFRKLINNNYLTELKLQKNSTRKLTWSHIEKIISNPSYSSSNTVRKYSMESFKLKWRNFVCYNPSKFVKFAKSASHSLLSKIKCILRNSWHIITYNELTISRIIIRAFNQDLRFSKSLLILTFEKNYYK